MTQDDGYAILFLLVFMFVSGLLVGRMWGRLAQIDKDKGEGSDGR